MNFQDNGTPLAGGGAVALLNVNGVMTATVHDQHADISAGHPITAIYAANGNFAASTSAALNQIVGKDATAIALSSIPNPSAVGQGVVFTATLSAVAPGALNTLAGETVKFFDGITLLDTQTLAPDRPWQPAPASPA